jgi:mannose-6-phosphate isomerase-like protein (cupin superfamily)
VIELLPVVDLGDIVEDLEPWSPVDVAVVNDQVVRAALFDGEYHWHKHDEEDELFMVYMGRIRIHLEDEIVELSEGQLCVVPKGVLHKPEADNPSVVLLFEPSVLKSRGD